MTSYSSLQFPLTGNYPYHITATFTAMSAYLRYTRAGWKGDGMGGYREEVPYAVPYLLWLN